MDISFTVVCKFYFLIILGFNRDYFIAHFKVYRLKKLFYILEISLINFFISHFFNIYTCKKTVFHCGLCVQTY